MAGDASERFRGIAPRGGAAAQGFEHAEAVVQLGVGLVPEGGAQVVGQGRVAAVGGTQRLPGTRGQNRVGMTVRPVRVALLNQGPVFLDLGDNVFPDGTERVTLGLDPPSFRDSGLAHVLVG